MKEYKNLIDLVSVLNRLEQNEVVNNLRLKENVLGKDISLKYFKTLISNPNMEFSKAHELLYKKPNILAFKKLNVRLLDTIINVLLVKDNILFDEKYDLRAKEVFNLERQMLIAEILRYRGLFDLSKHKLNKVISLSKKYEHFDLLIYSTEKKMKWIFTELNIDEVRQYEREIDYYINCNSYIKDSFKIYSSVIKIDKEKATVIDKLMIRNSIKQIEGYYSKSKIKQILFYLLYIKIQYYNLMEDYKKCISSLDTLIELLTNNKEISSKTRYGSALLNKALFLRSVKMHELSIALLLDAKKYFLGIRQNHIIVYQQLFLSYYYSKNLAKAKYYLRLMDEFIINDKSSDKILYFNSVVNFYEGAFKESIKYLNEISRVSSVNGFNFSVRLLRILNYIELKKFDVSDNLIDKLGLFLRSEKDKSFMYSYYISIYRILSKLSNGGYNIDSILSTIKSDITEVEKGILRVYGSVNGLVDFKFWIEDKRNFDI